MKEWLLVSILLAGFMLVVSATTPQTTSGYGLGYDGAIYAAAVHPELVPGSRGDLAPWRYRLLTPAVTALLPWEWEMNARVVSVGGSAGALLLMWVWLRRAGLPMLSAVLGTAFAAGVFWSMKWAFFAPGYIDGPTQLFLLIAFLFDESGWALLLLSALAPLQKESLLPLLCVRGGGILYQRGWTHRASLIVASWIVAGGAVFVALRVLLPVSNAAEDQFVKAAQQIGYVLLPELWIVLAHATFSGLGLIVVVLLARPHAWWPTLTSLEWRGYVLLSLALAMFGGTDKGRLFLYLLPPACLAVGRVVTAVRAEVSAARFAPWIAIVLGAHFYMGHYFSPIPAGEELGPWLLPEFSGLASRPYFFRFTAIAVATFAATWQLVGVEWRYRAAPDVLRA